MLVGGRVWGFQFSHWIACKYVSEKKKKRKKKRKKKKSQYFLIADMTVEVCKITDCLNGGVCIRQGDTERCLCTAGYYGEECEDSLVKKKSSAQMSTLSQLGF